MGRELFLRSCSFYGYISLCEIKLSFLNSNFEIDKKVGHDSASNVRETDSGLKRNISVG